MGSFLAHGFDRLAFYLPPLLFVCGKKGVKATDGSKEGGKGGSWIMYKTRIHSN